MEMKLQNLSSEHYDGHISESLVGYYYHLYRNLQQTN